MKTELTPVGGITAESCDIIGYDRVVANAIILAKDNQILLQRRMPDDSQWPDALAMFGGGLEDDESVIAALQRELQEEIEVSDLSPEPILLGAHSFTQKNGSRLMVSFFWHDQNDAVGECHDDKPEYFESAALALGSGIVHPGTHWALQECVRRGLIPA